VLGLKSLDLRIPREHRAVMIIRAPANADPADLEHFLSAAPYRARFRRLKQASTGDGVELEFDIRWKRPELSDPPFDLIGRVAAPYAMVSMELTSEPAS